MKVSLNWLHHFVSTDGVSPEELASKMTFAGVEVEEVTHLAKATNLVIGEILSCEKHPDSDHLHVLQVDEGTKYGIHQIVCGAPNARKGLRVIVAREGAVLPLVTIEKSTIRGMESDGMCCALYELGVDKKYLNEKQLSGIEELPLDAPIGEEKVLAYLGLDDAVLELKLLANRPDLNAMENVAREVACLLDKKATIEEYSETPREKTSFKVSSLSEKCPLFSAAVVEGIQVGPSPLWLSRILTAQGVRSINNVVDIGNFVMLLTGQPLNMYDLDQLSAPELSVKDDFAGDFVAMDGKSYALQKGDLVVTSKGAPVCLAGIMTSLEASVKETTKSIVIESAVFNGAAIRHTSNRLGLMSESSARFVKGLNVDQSERVLRIAVALLFSLAQGKKASENVVYDVLKHEKKTIVTSLSYINARLGTSFSMPTVEAVLKRDNLPLKALAKDSFAVEVPSYRIDMVGEADVSEEVIRLLGYENIVSKLPTSSMSLSGGLSPLQKDRLAIRRYLRGHGLMECLTYSLVNAKEKDELAYLHIGECYLLKNPMTDDHCYLRKNTLASLVDAATYNLAHQAEDFALFEVSDVDAPSYQSNHLSVVLIGKENIQGSLARRPYDFYSLKGLAEGIFTLLGLNLNRIRMVKLVSKNNEFHPGRSAALYLGKDLLAVLGEFHPSFKKEHDLPEEALGMEMDLSLLLSLKTSPEKAEIPARFPSVSRDLAFLIDKKVSYEDVKKEIGHTDKLIIAVEIFDLYEGENIASSKKSMAVRLTLANPEKTLKDEEVAAVIGKVVEALQMRFAAEIRS